MVGIRSFPFGMTYFQGRTVSFRGCNRYFCNSQRQDVLFFLIITPISWYLQNYIISWKIQSVLQEDNMTQQIPTKLWPWHWESTTYGDHGLSSLTSPWWGIEKVNHPWQCMVTPFQTISVVWCKYHWMEVSKTFSVGDHGFFLFHKWNLQMFLHMTVTIFLDPLCFFEWFSLMRTVGIQFSLLENEKLYILLSQNCFSSFLTHLNFIDFANQANSLTNSWSGHLRHLGQTVKFPRSLYFSNQKIRETTVDGWNPAAVDMVNIPLFIGFHTSQVVSRISAINSIQPFGCFLI